MAARHRRHSHETAAETLEWMNAIVEFVRPYKHLLDAHVVNFFKDRLWETVDEDWMDCLRKEPVDSLLKIPSGFVQDHWPESLREFVLGLRSLVLFRGPNISHSMLPDLDVVSVSNVLAQGMNMKKKHEVEVLAAIVKTIADGVNSETIVDVGAGQGYLAQVLSFQYQLSVIAVDASLHHASVTSARSERIKKHYAAKMRKSQTGDENMKVPQTVTCRVLSSDTLATLTTASLHGRSVKQTTETESYLAIDGRDFLKGNEEKTINSSHGQSTASSLVLAGLHACGDLSVNMIRTFMECKEVKAVVSIGCCYNLLSEEISEKIKPKCGFPMSNSAKLSGFILGKNARDLACQSAERWKSLTKDAACQNFELHVYRAAFQMVLDKFFPDLVTSSPSIGRRGKALRRQQIRRERESRLGQGRDVSPLFSSKEDYEMKDGECKVHSPIVVPSDVEFGEVISDDISNKHMSFEEFCKSGLSRLGLGHSQDIDFLEIWSDVQPFSELVGPYWSLRAALGPLVETYILLDRLLFLQEQGNSVEASLFPIFDPELSPRNVAVIARRSDVGAVVI